MSVIIEVTESEARLASQRPILILITNLISQPLICIPGTLYCQGWQHDGFLIPRKEHCRSHLCICLTLTGQRLNLTVAITGVCMLNTLYSSPRFICLPSSSAYERAKMDLSVRYTYSVRTVLLHVINHKGEGPRVMSRRAMNLRHNGKSLSSINIKLLVLASTPHQDSTIQCPTLGAMKAHWWVHSCSALNQRLCKCTSTLLAPAAWFSVGGAGAALVGLWTLPTATGGL